MIKTETKEINGKVYACTQFAGTKNFVVLHKLATVIGPTFAHGIGTGELNAEVNIGAAVDALLERLGTTDQALALVNLLLANTMVDGIALSDKVNFDATFAGPAILDLGAVLMFVVETNFGDFSVAAAAITSQFGAKASPIPSQND